MNILNIGIFGNILFIVIYSYLLINNINDDKYYIGLGFLLLLLGHIVAMFEKYNDSKEINKKERTIYTSHLILGLYFILNYIITISDHKQKSDILGMFGHIIIAYGLYKHNINIERLGFISLCLYYILYIINNINEPFLINNLKVLSSISMSIYYIYNTMKENKIKKK